MRSGPTRDEGLVLRTLRLGETSKIVSTLTRDHGRVKLVAKGARRPENRLASLLEPGNELELVLYPRADRDLWMLSDASLRRAALTGGKTLDTLSHLLAALELADRHLPEREPLPEVEALYRRFLDRWHHTTPAFSLSLFFGLELAFLEALGLGLDANRCLGCGRGLAQGARSLHRIEEGGLVCPACASAGGRWIEGEHVGCLQSLAACLEDGEAVQLESNTRRAVGRTIHDHMTFHLPHYRVPRALYWSARSQEQVS